MAEEGTDIVLWSDTPQLEHVSHTHRVVPTPFHNPLTPVSRRTAAISEKNPPRALGGPCCCGSTSVADPPDPILRDNACSIVTVSPHMPVHFEGCKQPEGGGIVDADPRREAKESSACDADKLEGVGPEEKQVRVLFAELAGKRVRCGVKTEV